MPSPPVYNSPPKWLQEPPSTFPITQPIYCGISGPYVNTSTNNSYWIFNEEEDGSGTNFDIVVYKSTTFGTTQPGTRIASGIRIASGQGTIGVSYPGTGNLIYICYWAYTGVDQFTGNLSVVTFNMTTETFGSPNATGISITGSDGCSKNIAFLLPNGRIRVHYDYGSNSNTNWSTYSVDYASGSWSGPLTVGNNSGTVFEGGILIAATPASGSNTGVFWTDATGNGRGVNGHMYYSVVSATGTLVGTTTISALDSFAVGLPYPFYYDSVSDTAIMLGIENTVEFVNLYIASPSGAVLPTCTKVQVYDDAADNYDYEIGAVVGNAVGNQFNVFMWDTDNNVLHVFQSSTIQSGWTGPTVFYSQSANPPNPAPSAPEIFPNYATYIPNGDLVITSGFLVNSITGFNICGVMAAMNVPSAPPPATQIIPEFPANPYPPPPYCIINKLVMYEVITNGSDTSAVLQTNLDVSAQNLSYGFPTVTFEMLDAAAYSATPYVISKSANTVTIGFSAIAASFRVVIDETNTLLR